MMYLLDPVILAFNDKEDYRKDAASLGCSLLTEKHPQSALKFGL